MVIDLLMVLVRDRYIKALQQFQRVSSLIDAVAAQQMKLEARRDHLQTLMTALTAMYKVAKGHHQPTPTSDAAAVPLMRDVVSYSVPSSVDHSRVTSSRAADCYLPTDNLRSTEPLNASQDLSPADDSVVVYEQRQYHNGECSYYDGPTDIMLKAAHSTINRVNITLSSVDCPPPAHAAKADLTGYTYIVRNSCEAAVTDD